MRRREHEAPAYCRACGNWSGFCLVYDLEPDDRAGSGNVCFCSVECARAFDAAARLTRETATRSYQDHILMRAYQGALVPKGRRDR